MISSNFDDVKGNIQVDNSVNLDSIAELFCLHDCSWEAVKEEGAFGDLVDHDFGDEVVWNELPAVHEPLRFLADSRAFLNLESRIKSSAIKIEANLSSQHITGASVRHLAVVIRDSRRNGTLAGAWRTHDNSSKLLCYCQLHVYSLKEKTMIFFAIKIYSVSTKKVNNEEKAQ